MRRFIHIFLFAFAAWIAFAPHAESQDQKPDALPAHALARIGTTRYQVSHYRRAMLLAPDGKRLVVVNPVDGIDVWQLPAWTRERTIRIDSIDPDIEARFGCLAITPDSKKLLIFNVNTEQILVFDFTAGKVVRRIALPVDGPCHDPLIVAGNDSKTCIFTWDDASTRKQAFLVYDLDKGKLKQSCKFAIDRQSQWPQFAIAPDGRRVVRHVTPEHDGMPGVFVGGASSLEIWDLAEGKAVRTIKTNVPMKKLLVSPDSKTLVALDNISSLRNFDLEAGKERKKLKDEFGDFLALASDGKSIYLGESGGTLLRQISADNTIQVGNAARVPCPISQLALPSDGKLLALGVRRNTVFLWDAATGKLLSPTDVPSGAVKHLTFSGQGELFIAAENGHAAWWNPRTGVKLRDAKPGDPAQHGTWNGTWTREISPDGVWLAVNEKNERIRISRADGRGRREPVELRIPDREFIAIAFSPDGRQLTCATVDPSSSPRAGPVYIYEMSSKKIRLELPGHPSGTIERLAYAPDSALLASAATDALVHVWQAGLHAHVQVPSSRKPTEKNLHDWYIAMAGNDAPAAFQSMIKLAEAPTPAAKLFAAKIPPAPQLDTAGRTVAQWIGDLGSGRFGVRSKANAMLLKLGPSAERELRAVLLKPPDLEVKRRIEGLLDRIAAAGDYTPTDIFHGRAVEVLEAIAAPEAHAVLTRWAAGDPGAVLTVEARQALARLSHQANGK